MNLLRAARESKSTVHLLSDLHSKLGTWAKVAKAVGVTERSLRRYRDGTRSPAKAVQSRTKDAAQSRKIRTTKDVPIQAGAGNISIFKKAIEKARREGYSKIQVVIHYRVAGEDRYESFIIFDDEDEEDLQEQLDDYLDMIYNDIGQSRKNAEVVSVDIQYFV
jgi:hypothetical protein